MNPIDSVAALRPSDHALDELWPAAERASALERVLAGTVDTAASRHQRRRRAVTMGLPVAAAAVAAAIVVPLISPPDGPGSASPAAAAELTRMAQIAATSPGPTASRGQFLHLLTEDRQPGRLGIAANGTARPVNTVVLERWTAYDGTIWRRDKHNPNPVDYYKFPPGGGDTAAPSPSYLNSLPTDPATLEKLLRHNPDEPNGSDGAMFTAVGDLLRGGFAPAALRTALVTVLKDLPHVTLGAATSDALGRPAVQFTIADQGSLFFDPATAQIIEETDPSMGFISIVKIADVVNAVPTDVLKHAQPQH
jgi:hypothetical protein